MAEGKPRPRHGRAHRSVCAGPRSPRDAAAPRPYRPRAAVLETGLGEDTQHSRVTRHHFCEKFLDPDTRPRVRAARAGVSRCLGLGYSSATANATSAVLASRSRTYPARRRSVSSIRQVHHARPNQARASARPVDCRRGVPVEAAIETLVGKPAEELEQGACVALHRCAKPHRRAVTEDNVRYDLRYRIHDKRG